MNKGRRYLFAILCFTLIFSLAPVLPLAKQTQAATGLGLAESPWPMFQHDPQHTGSPEKEREGVIENHSLERIILELIIDGNVHCQNVNTGFQS